jgi:hypothetical protein
MRAGGWFKATRHSGKEQKGVHPGKGAALFLCVLHLRAKACPIARSTLADVNHRRPPAVFAETFAMLLGLADRQLRREGADMIRVLDATPIPLGKLHGWA